MNVLLCKGGEGGMLVQLGNETESAQTTFIGMHLGGNQRLGANVAISTEDVAFAMQYTCDIVLDSSAETVGFISQHQRLIRDYLPHFKHDICPLLTSKEISLVEDGLGGW